MLDSSAAAVAAPVAKRTPGRATSMPKRVVVPTKHRVSIGEIVTSWPIARVVGSRDMKIKYKQSALGPIWLVVQPAAMLGAMVIVFTGVTTVNTGGVPYVLFALAGLSVWSYFQQAVSTASGVMQHNAAAVKRTACPRIALVMGNVVAAAPALGVVVGASLVGALIVRGLPTQVLLLPLVVAWTILFTAAIALILATVAARFRDAVAVVPLLIQVGVFASPVGYPTSQTHGAIKVLVLMNPLSGLIEAMRWSLLGTSPSITAILIAAPVTVAAALCSWFLFARSEVRFADYV
jgi:lipopolysaccharide transport system permease protein